MVPTNETITLEPLGKYETLSQGSRKCKDASRDNSCSLHLGAEATPVPASAVFQHALLQSNRSAESAVDSESTRQRRNSPPLPSEEFQTACY